ncbi:MAG TPA: LLM class flavin-dependent oxidoreductase [Streptosporangiaceae bacterium]|nr:LLM class flavin-dependent oxidoreductase [Streptosporangiaceae bacterium]
MSLSLGFGLITCQRYPGDPRSDTEIYAQALDLAEQAERGGLDSVWVSEHHFVDDAYLPSLLPLAAAIAARTSRLRIGTGLLLAPLHDPLRLAEDAAVTDLISGGRLILGVGLGWREEEFAGLGVPLAQRVPRLVASLDTMRLAWRGELVAGAAGRPAVPVRPRPAQPGGPPLWIGAMSEPAIRRAGLIADGFMATEVTPGMLASQVAWAREAFRGGGRTGPFQLSVHLPVFAWDGPGAWELIRDQHRYIGWKYEDMDDARGRGGEPAPPPPLTAGEEAALRSSIILGTPGEVAAAIDDYRRAAGGDLVFIARLYFPGLPWDIQQRALRLFAGEVAPRARELAASGA